jgi:molecular chaperone Hsp33
METIARVGTFVEAMTMTGDRLIQGLALGGDVRILAAQTTESVTGVTSRLDLSPVAATALGRVMTGAVLLARLLDKHYRNQKVTLRFEGGGPLGVVIAEGSVDGTMRGTVGEAQYDDDGRVNVGEAIGKSGVLTVIRGTPPDGRPYTTQIHLQTGEVASDITRYLAESEQIYSAVLLGVLTRPTGIASAGGLIVQAFPHAQDEAVQRIEEQIRKAPPLSVLLDKMPLEEAVRQILPDSDYKQIDESYNVPLQYHCGCTRERALAPFQLFDRLEIGDMIQKGGAEVICQFCGERYFLTAEELMSLPGAVDA